MDPERVEIENPVFGFSEKEILEQLFESAGLKLLEDMEAVSDNNFYRKSIALDAKMYRRAKSLGYDAIVLMTQRGKKALQKGWKPNSIELNLMYC